MPLSFLLCALPIAGAVLVFDETKIPLAAYSAVSALTFLVYGIDKALAVKNRSAAHGNALPRVPEKTLHALEFFGGFFGGFLGQLVWRHKSSKRSYRLVFLLIAALHASAWILFFTVFHQGGIFCVSGF